MKNTIKTKFLTAISCVVMFSATSGFASDKELLAELKALKARMSELEKSNVKNIKIINDLKKQITTNTTPSKTQQPSKQDEVTSKIQPQVNAEPSVEQKPVQQKPDDVIVSLTPNLNFKTVDGKRSFALDGRIGTDAGFVTKDGPAKISDATEVRFIWLGMQGKLQDDWTYRFLTSVDGSANATKDAFVNYTGFKNMDIQIGHFFENNGIEVMTPDLHYTFIERSPGITTFKELRRVGVSFDPYGENWGAQIGFFGSTIDTKNIDDDGYGISSRFHIDALNKVDKSLHLGVNSSFRNVGSTKNFRYRTKGQTHVISTYLLDTNNISGVENTFQNGAELRYRIGALALTGEYLLTDIYRTALPNLQFNGAYANASYFLTGEQRGYDIKKGVATRLIPFRNFSLSNGGIGAWEVAGGYSYVDLNSKDIKAGIADIYNMGINWYPTSNVKFMLNYSVNKIDGSTVISNSADPQYIMLRSQVDF
jgi:phosphate-selective porin OprO/OprP